MGRAGSVISGMRPGAVTRNSAMMAYWIACMADGGGMSALHVKGRAPTSCLEPTRGSTCQR